MNFNYTPPRFFARAICLLSIALLSSHHLAYAQPQGGMFFMNPCPKQAISVRIAHQGNYYAGDVVKLEITSAENLNTMSAGTFNGNPVDLSAPSGLSGFNPGLQQLGFPSSGYHIEALWVRGSSKSFTPPGSIPINFELEDNKISCTYNTPIPGAGITIDPQQSTIRSVSITRGHYVLGEFVPIVVNSIKPDLTFLKFTCNGYVITTKPKKGKATGGVTPYTFMYPARTGDATGSIGITLEAKNTAGIKTLYEKKRIGIRGVTINGATFSAVSKRPASRAAEVSVNESVSVAFDKKVSLNSSVSTKVTLTSPSPSIATITVPDDDLLLARSGKVVLSLSGQLQYSTFYTVTIPAYKFKNDTGASEAISWTFVTARDPTLPSITSVSPAHQASGVSPGSPLRLEFSEKGVTPQNISKGITIHYASNGEEVQAINPVSLTSMPSSGQKTTYSLHPHPLSGDTKYYVQVAEGAFQYEDGHSNAAYGGPTVWSFTTAVETISPAVTDAKPAAASTAALNASIVLTFGEPVVLGHVPHMTLAYRHSRQVREVNIPLRHTQVNGIGTDKIIITPPHGLPSGQTLTATVPQGAFQDASGNSSPEYSWKFSTATLPVAFIASTNAAGSRLLETKAGSIETCTDTKNFITPTGGKMIIAEANLGDFYRGGTVELTLRGPFEFKPKIQHVPTIIGFGGESVRVVVKSRQIILTLPRPNRLEKEKISIPLQNFEIKNTDGDPAATAQLVRTGGTAVLYGLPPSEDIVYLNVSNRARKAAPDFTKTIGRGTAEPLSDGGFWIAPSTSFSLAPSSTIATGSSLHWYYFNKTPINPKSPLSVDENSLAGGTFPNNFSHTAPGLYTLFVNEKEADGCVSEDTKINIMVAESNLADDPTIFSKTAISSKIIEVSNPADHKAGVIGPGLSGRDDKTKPAYLRYNLFTEKIAVGLYTFRYTLTNDQTKESFNQKKDYNIIEQDDIFLLDYENILKAYNKRKEIRVLLTNPKYKTKSNLSKNDLNIFLNFFSLLKIKDEFCKEESQKIKFVSKINSIPPGGSFDKIQGKIGTLGFKDDLVRRKGGIKKSRRLPWAFNHKLWEFHPEKVNLNALSKEGVPQSVDILGYYKDKEDISHEYASKRVYVYGPPALSFPTLEGNYCQTDAPVKVEVRLARGATSKALSFASIRVQKSETGKKDGAFVPIGVLSETKSGAGVYLNFAELYNGTSKLSQSGPGTYKLIVNTPAQVDISRGDINNKKCPGEAEFIFELFAKPQPLKDDPSFKRNYFVCQGSTDPITLVDNSGRPYKKQNTTYTWYAERKPSGVSSTFDPTVDTQLSGVTSGTLSNSSRITNSYDENTPGTYYFWVSQTTNANPGQGFAGCESEPTLIAVTVLEDGNSTKDILNYEHRDHTGNTVKINPNTASNTPDLTLYYCNGSLTGSEAYFVSSTYTGAVIPKLGKGPFKISKRFTWYQSSKDGGKLSPIRTTGNGSRATANDLRIAVSEKIGDGVDHFLVTQTVGIVEEGGKPVYAGCESKGILIRVERFKPPDAPDITQQSGISNAENDFYFCEGSPIADIEATASNNAQFKWYNSLLLKRPIATTNGVSSRHSLNGADMGLGSGSAAGSYSFFVRQTTNRKPNVGFQGCESVPTAVKVKILTKPEMPAFVLVPLGCAGDGKAVNLALNNYTPGDDIKWYVTESSPPSFETAFSTVAPLKQAKENDLLGVQGHLKKTKRNVYSALFYAYAIRHQNIVTDFQGCASDKGTRIVIQHPTPPPPTTVGSAGLGSRTLDGSTEVYNICQGTSAEEFLDESTTESELAFFRWYTKDPTKSTSFNTIGAIGRKERSLQKSDTRLALKVIQAAGLLRDIAGHSTDLYLTRKVFGCESPPTQVRIIVNPLPQLTITPPTGKTIVDDAVAFCFDETAKTKVFTGGSDQTGTGQFKIETTQRSLELSTGSTFSFDIAARHRQAGKSEFGSAANDHSLHTLTYNFENDVTPTQKVSCAASKTIEIRVNPIPKLHLSSGLNKYFRSKQGNPLGTDLGETLEICESEEDFDIEGLSPDEKGIGSFKIIRNSSPTKHDEIRPRTLSNAHDMTFEVGKYGSLIPDGKHYEDVKVNFHYTETASGCENTVFKVLRIHDTPEVTFDFTGGCTEEATEFIPKIANASTSAYSIDDFDYDWTFAPQEGSGIPNSQLQKPSVTFPRVEDSEMYRVNVSLVVKTKNVLPTGKRCANKVTPKLIGVLDTPQPAFVWTLINTPQHPLILTPRATRHKDVNIVEIEVDFGDKAMPTPESRRSAFLFAGDKLLPFEHTYPAPGEYTIKMGMTVQAPSLFTDQAKSCTGHLTRKVVIEPLVEVTKEQPYLEDFETSKPGWHVETLQNKEAVLQGDATDRPTSWRRAQIDFKDVLKQDPQKINNGHYVWSTTGTPSGKTYLEKEDSWLYTPVFDLSGMNRPALSFDVLTYFENPKDGVVMQYSTNQGADWKVLGSYSEGTSSGINWYNFDNISADPGQQIQEGAVAASGWSGYRQDDSYPKWRNARHSLSEIGGKDRKAVGFRFAIASIPGNKHDYFGFALDDFMIFNQERNILVEEFLHEEAYDFTSESVNLVGDINRLVHTTEGVITLAYPMHFGLKGDLDLKTKDTESNVRSVYYSVDELTSFLDGGNGNVPNRPLDWDQKQLALETLEVPGFSIALTASAHASATQIRGQVTFKAEQNYPAGTELLAYVVIVEEKTLSDGTAVSLVRKLLPQASGAYAKLKSDLARTGLLPIGSADDVDKDKHTLNFDWTITSQAHIEDFSQLAAVVFIQNYATRQVYQAKKIEVGADLVKNKAVSRVTSVAAPLLRQATDFQLYPSPADREVHLKLVVPPTENLRWIVSDQTGKIIRQGTWQAGESQVRFLTEDCASGIYHVALQGTRRTFRPKKLIVIH